MKFNNHYEIPETKHAFLSPSSYHWINYTADKVRDRYFSKRNVALGTELHEYAKNAIRLKQRQSNRKNCINRYINDAIGFDMTPEVTLVANRVCFGKADAISFDGNKLMIFDLKTGQTPAKFEQLDIYSALFCIEYGINPLSIDIEERIYQFDSYTSKEPDQNYILQLMGTIEDFSSIVEELANAEDTGINVL